MNRGLLEAARPRSNTAASVNGSVHGSMSIVRSDSAGSTASGARRKDAGDSNNNGAYVSCDKYWVLEKKHKKCFIGAASQLIFQYYMDHSFLLNGVLMM